MFAKLIILFAVLALALARPQLYSGYGSYGGYNGYASSYPGYYGYSGYSNPVGYGSYSNYGVSPFSYGYGYY